MLVASITTNYQKAVKSAEQFTEMFF